MIPVDIFNIDVGVYDSFEARVEHLRETQSVEDPVSAPHESLAASYMDEAGDGSMRYTMVLTPRATRGTWVHECVHMADFIMHSVGIPTGYKNTEVRAYLTAHLFSCIEEEMPCASP